MSHTYDVGTKAWQPDQTEGWVASEVEQKVVDGDNVKLVFALESGEVRYQPFLPLSSRWEERTAHTDSAREYRVELSRRPSPRSTMIALPPHSRRS